MTPSACKDRKRSMTSPCSASFECPYSAPLQVSRRRSRTVNVTKQTRGCVSFEEHPAPEWRNGLREIERMSVGMGDFFLGNACYRMGFLGNMSTHKSALIRLYVRLGLRVQLQTLLADFLPRTSPPNSRIEMLPWAFIRNCFKEVFRLSPRRGCILRAS